MTKGFESKSNIKWPHLLFIASVFTLLLYLPIFENNLAQRAFAVLVLAALLWITEAIPVALTGLLIPFLAILLHLATPTAAFSQFANPILFLFMGGFVLAGALSLHSLDKLIAHKLIRLAKGNFYWSAIALMLATALAACWVTNTAAAAMMIPLGIGMLVLIKRNTVSAEAKFLMIGIAYSANIGGILTMVSSPPNAIGAAILDLSFGPWLLYSGPLFLLMFPIMIAFITFYFKPDRKMTIDTVLVTNDKIPLNKTLIVIFLFTVILWVLDSVLSPLFNIENSFSSLVAILAIFLLFATKIMDWSQILESINWNILLLFGGGLTLGMLIETSGLGGLLVGKVAHLATEVPLFVFLWLIVFFSIVMTEFMSNTASAALILPLLYTMAAQLQVNPMILVLPATIAASFGFMMPVGTPPNAMAFGTGLIPRKDMLMAGLLVNFISSIVVTSFFYLIFS